MRRDVLREQNRALATTAAFAGTPSVAHAEALLRTVELRGDRSSQEPLDALVVGVPWIGPHLPREPLNPVTSAAIVARARAPALARRVPGPRGRHARPRPLAHALLRPRAPQDPYRGSSTRSRRATRTPSGVGARRRATSAPSPPTGRDGRATRSFPTPTGPAAARRCRASAASSSRAAATPSPRAPSASSRATRSRARSRWPTASRRARARRRPARAAVRRRSLVGGASALAEVGLADLARSS